MLILFMTRYQHLKSSINLEDFEDLLAFQLPDLSLKRIKTNRSATLAQKRMDERCTTLEDIEDPQKPNGLNANQC
jgi:hypothetical protein